MEHSHHSTFCGPMTTFGGSRDSLRSDGYYPTSAPGGSTRRASEQTDADDTTRLASSATSNSLPRHAPRPPRRVSSRVHSPSALANCGSDAVAPVARGYHYAHQHHPAAAVSHAHWQRGSTILDVDSYGITPSSSASSRLDHVGTDDRELRNNLDEPRAYIGGRRVDPELERPDDLRRENISEDRRSISSRCGVPNPSLSPAHDNYDSRIPITRISTTPPHLTSTTLADDPVAISPNREASSSRIASPTQIVSPAHVAETDPADGSSLSSPAHSMRTSQLTSPVHPVSPAPHLSNDSNRYRSAIKNAEMDMGVDLVSPAHKAPESPHRSPYIHSPCTEGEDTPVGFTASHTHDSESPSNTASSISTQLSNSSSINSSPAHPTSSAHPTSPCSTPTHDTCKYSSPVYNTRRYSGTSKNSSPANKPSSAHSCSPAHSCSSAHNSSPAHNSSRNITPVHISDTPLQSSSSSPFRRQKNVTTVDNSRHHPYNVTSGVVGSPPLPSLPSLPSSSRNSSYDNADDEEIVIVIESEMDVDEHMSLSPRDARVLQRDAMVPQVTRTYVRLRSVESPSVDLKPKTPPRLHRVKAVPTEFRSASPPPTYRTLPSVQTPSTVPQMDAPYTTFVIKILSIVKLIDIF